MFAYCLNNPIILLDPSGTIPFYDDPLQQAIEEFFKWYNQTDENETSNGKLTLAAKLKRTFTSFARNVELSVGLGVGLGEELEIIGVGESICAGYDIIAVQYCDGKWDFGQRIFGSLSASFTQILELGGGFDAFRDFDGNADFVGWLIYNNKRESWTLLSVSGYPIFLGGNLEIGFDLNQFLYDLSAIWEK